MIFWWFWRKNEREFSTALTNCTGGCSFRFSLCSGVLGGLTKFWLIRADRVGAAALSGLDRLPQLGNK